QGVAVLSSDLLDHGWCKLHPFANFHVAFAVVYWTLRSYFHRTLWAFPSGACASRDSNDSFQACSPLSNTHWCARILLCGIRDTLWANALSVFSKPSRHRRIGSFGKRDLLRQRSLRIKMLLTGIVRLTKEPGYSSLWIVGPTERRFCNCRPPGGPSRKTSGNSKSRVRDCEYPLKRSSSAASYTRSGEAECRMIGGNNQACSSLARCMNTASTCGTPESRFQRSIA